jgi:negative regulator of flagellin synthesis FlgM
MEIDKNAGIQIDAYVNQVHDKNKGGPAAEKADNTAAKTDTVVISDAAKRIQEARAQLDEIPDVREDKVAELRDQIRNGTYQENPEMTATNLLKEHLFNDQFQK